MSDQANEANEKVEEVNLDELEDAPAHDARARPPSDAAPAVPAAHDAPAAGSTTIEEVRPEELAQVIPVPELETSPWALAGPLLVALALMWNVDWKDARIKAETAARRRARQPPARRPA